MASVNDKLITMVPLWSGTVGSGGVANGTDTTIPLASASGLTEGSIYILTIDRVDSAGTKTLSKREVVIGEVSGDSLINCTRGAEGTAQAHSAGAVVELLFTAKQWNRLVEGVDAEHDADGTHMDGIPLTTPKITTSINDANGNEVIKTPATSSAVNEITVTNAAANGSPSITATGGDTNINLLIAGKGTGVVIPQIPLAEGQMINGKIVPSVASNNLTVALKTMAGDDPSANTPVYVRIGGVIRSVTGALSVTKNAGTNWCNAGGSELATKEIDYFVYLFWDVGANAVGMVFSRIPYATVGVDMDGLATTAEKHQANNGAYAEPGEVVVNIGRFAATLSAGAGYTWSVPTFTATNLIQRPIYETRWLDWVPTLTADSTDMSKYDTAKYRIGVGNLVNIEYVATGVTMSGSAGSAMSSLPFTNVQLAVSPVAINNGTAYTTSMIVLNVNTIQWYKTAAAGSWAASETAVALYLKTSYRI